jgi:hypothetical protein
MVNYFIHINLGNIYSDIMEDIEMDLNDEKFIFQKIPNINGCLTENPCIYRDLT